MVLYQNVIVPLSATLGLSVLIERILEFLSNLSERFLRTQEGHRIPKPVKSDQMIQEFEDTYRINEESKNTEQRVESKIKQRTADKQQLEQTKRKILETEAKLDETRIPEKREELEQTLKTLNAELISLKEKLAKDEKESEWGERFSNTTILVEPTTDPDDGLTLKRFVLQLLGFALGIIFVRISGILLFNNLGASIPDHLDYLLTGLLIGGGSTPMHFLIRFITTRKITTTEKIQASEVEEPTVTPMTATEQPQAPAVISKPPDIASEEWIDIPYNGGVDREKLEGIHRRIANPDMIVYHHTAMDRQSTFEDVVRVIKSRKDSKGNNWVTGYNCVIHESGSIHPFCRWDRYGNHAAGYNRRSLGIAYIGNFETDPYVPFSNPDGRMGPPQPTEVQLKAGARLVTLWTFLYSIDLDFNKLIIPHREISTKTCPGSAFPYDAFIKWIEFYRNRWEKSEAIKEHIEQFKMKPYLYI
jgi:hypothetical protein